MTLVNAAAVDACAVARVDDRPARTIRPGARHGARSEVFSGLASLPARPAREHALCERLAAGDERALRDTYRMHAPAVFGLAMRVLANQALAEEVTQDVFVRLWEQPQRFDAERGTLRSYLLAMTHSRAVERVRSEESLRRRHEAAAEQSAPSGAGVSSEDPARVAVDRDTESAVRRALAALPESQRVPIELAYFDGLSYREVAEVLAEPEGTVKYRIRAGMQKLRAALQAVEVAP